MISSDNNSITFMFTDIEGSTRLWEEHDRAMEAVLSLHDEILHGTVKEYGGLIFKHTGDGLAAAFPEVDGAARAALHAQRLLASADWGPIGELRARIGIHNGRAQSRAGEDFSEYFGRDVNRCARIADAAHGGQVLISAPTADLLRAVAHAGWMIRDLGTHQLKDLSQPEQVFQLWDENLPSRFPPLRTVDRIPRQLPALADLFLGREDDIRKLSELLRGGRLVSLIGPGGVGKTQMAVATALDSIQDFPDGAWFCPLAGATTIAAIAELIETTMGLQVTSGACALERLANGLAMRRALLILDGVESSPAEIKHVVASLLEACRNVTIICTSRIVLHTRGEQVLAVGPLLVPDVDTEDPETARKNASVALFERRARLADSTFQVTTDNLAAVVSICRQLDGLPLAIELAAAQMAALDPQDLADRIGRRIGLIDDREKTLSTIIDWSYHTLSERERMLFQRLAVFAGGFTLALAERVCVDDVIAIDDVMPGLADLVNKSVISRQPTPDGSRYAMLELLSSYAMRALTDAAQTEARRQRHLEAYLEFAQAAQEGCVTRHEADWVKRFTVEYSNLRRAFAWAMESGQVAKALELIHYADSFARERFMQELDPFAAQALEAAKGDEPYRFAAQSVLASAAARRGDIDTALVLADEALESARKSGLADIFMPFRLVAITGILSGNPQRTCRASDEAIQLATERQRPFEIARFKAMKAHIKLLDPDASIGIDLALEALDEARTLRNPSLLAWCLYVAGTLDPDEQRALAKLEEAIEFADMVGNRYIAGIALQVSSWKRRSADRDEIASGFSRVIAHWYRVANWANLGSSLRLCAVSMHELNDELVAVIDGWLAHSEARSVLSTSIDDAYAGALAQVAARMGEESFAAASRQGANMDTTRFVHYCKDALTSRVR
jgi:predicted ATPase/class 3 adenylate cyclase